jgi:uncharacterized protein (DUF433 family)
VDERGKLRVTTTHVLLELLIHVFQQGDTPEQIVDSNLTLRLADVYAVIAYYLAHQAEVDTYVQQADEQADRVQREVEAGHTPATRALLERLCAAREQGRR